MTAGDQGSNTSLTLSGSVNSPYQKLQRNKRLLVPHLCHLPAFIPGVAKGILSRRFWYPRNRQEYRVWKVCKTSLLTTVVEALKTSRTAYKEASDMENKGQNVGYIRVSSVGQNTARQLDGIEIDRTFTDKASGKDRNRPELEECLKYVRAGDTLHVHSIDRLARDLGDLISIVKELTAKGVAVWFHKENMQFAGDKANPMNELLLGIMGSIAQFERTMIAERRIEGQQKAKALGKHIGRFSKFTAEQVADIKRRVAAGESKTVIAKEYGIARQTVYDVIVR